jgi:putative ABC transport system permease protein
MDTLLQDFRYAARRLLRSPGFTAVVLVTLTLGIGATTAIFSIVNAMLLQPLPYPRSDRLVMVWQDWRARGGPATEWFNMPDLLDWREQNGTLEEITAFGGWGPNLTGSGEPERLAAQQVTAGYFRVLGVDALLGRTFIPADEQPGAARVVVLSHAFWRQRFSADPRIVGQSIELNGEPNTVIGVMPERFRPPFDVTTQLWRVFLRDPAAGGCLNSRGCVVLQAFARMKPGVTVERAQTDLATIAARLAQQYPATNAGRGANVVPLQEQLTGDARPALLTLLGAVGFVLLIACVNVANLLLARGAVREREVAIRTALGAARARLVRQLLTESLLLALAGGALGLLLAVWGVDLLIAMVPAEIAALFEIGLSAPVLMFALGATILAGVMFGLAPALQGTRANLSDAFKEGGRGATAGGSSRMRAGLVVAEIAIALTLLVGSGLMLRSFMRLQGVDPGFDPSRLWTGNLALPPRAYPGDTAIVAFYTQLIDGLAARPEVASVAAVSVMPFSGNNTDTGISVEGRPNASPEQAPDMWYRIVTPAYHETMRIPLRAGRTFTAADREGTPGVAIMNETAARRLWPGESAVGKRFKFGATPPDSAPWVTVVGVVGDVRHTALETPATMEMYLPQAQIGARAMSLVIRATQDAGRLTPLVRAEVARLDPSLPIAGVSTMEQLLRASLAMPRLYMALLALFAAVALALAAVGIYGVIAYDVEQRTREIGVRMALGASREAVLGMVVRQAGVLAIAGIGAGLLAAFALSRVMRSFLYDVSTTDPLTFVAVPIVLGGVALLASYLPARRAAGVEPTVALRYE